MTTEGTQPLINPGPKGKVEVIPAGAKKGCLKGADQVFLRPTGAASARSSTSAATVPRHIADNGPAFQRAVDAAREHGNGAVAYIPGGNWKMRTTVNVTGGNYVISGAGFKTKMFWNAGTLGPCSRSPTRRT